MKIEGLILSEFHAKKGLTVIHIVPKNCVMTPQLFSLYNELILPREEICNKFTVIEILQNYYLLGVPSLSENTHEKAPYLRSRYIYSINILVGKQAFLNPKKQPLYKEIAKKLGYFFKFMEQTSNVVYNNEKTINYIKGLMEKTYKDLSERNKCVLSHLASCYTIINLNSSPFQSTQFTQIKKSSVPITFLNQEQIDDIQSEFGRKLMKYAHLGDFNIKKICEEMENQNQVFKFYEKAISMGLVKMVDMFCLENRYCLTPTFQQYIPNGPKHDQLDQICRQITIKKGKKGEILKNTSLSEKVQKMQAQQLQNKIVPNSLLKVYFQISRKITLRTLIDNNLDFMESINIVKFIRISQVLGILRRIQQKFVVIGEEGEDFNFFTEENLKKQFFQSRMKGCRVQSNQQQCDKLNSLFSTHLKNRDSIDEICVSLCINKATLLKFLNYHNQKSLNIFYVSQ